MFRKKTSLFLLNLFGLILMFSACASTSTAGSMGNTSSLLNPNSRSELPPWVNDPYTKYDKQANVAAVGSASSREMAEKSALGNLVAIFGQNIQVDEKVSTSYRDAVRNGVIANWSENTAVDTAITTSAGMDSLIGAEIGEVWNDGINTYFAVAVLNKAKASALYSDMVMSNKAMIERLTNLPAGEKNTLSGYARYQFAATVADMTIPYVNLLSVIGGPVPDIKRGDDYRLEAVNITRAIPVGLTVRNDKSGRIQGAFAKALSDLGFSSGGNNSPYLLDVNITTVPSVIAGNPYKFTRIELKADLKDTKTGTVLLPYDFNSREGHTTQEEADNRAYTAAEQKINEEYADILSNYLSQLLPKR
jgi:hypothetical protein